MAASITVLKPFMAVYEKPLGYTGYSPHPAKAYGTSHSQAASFKMGAVVSSSEALPDNRIMTPANMDSNQITYSSRSPGPPRDRVNGAGHGRSDSIHSNDSRKLIIERKTAWSIRYEEAESHKSNASETAGSV
jgi:hypothetical protein